MSDDDQTVIPLRKDKKEEKKVVSSSSAEDTFKQATFAAVGCISWIAVVAALVGLFALVRAVFF